MITEKFGVDLLFLLRNSAEGRKPVSIPSIEIVTEIMQWRAFPDAVMGIIRFVEEQHIPYLMLLVDTA